VVYLDRRHWRHRPRTSPRGLRQVYEKEIEGFASCSAMLSYEKVKTSTNPEPATGGVAGGTYLFALPGSPGRLPRRAGTIFSNGSSTAGSVPLNLVELMRGAGDRGTAR